MALATALTSYTPGSVAPDASQVTITTPAAAKTIVYGNAVTFRGTVLNVADPENPAAIPDRRVYLELKMGGYLYVYVARTDNSGVWSVKLSKALRRNLTWSVNFPGSDTQAPDKATGHAIHVIPHLGSGVSASNVHRGTAFAFHGTSTPNMHGVRLLLQLRALGRSLVEVGQADPGGEERHLRRSDHGQHAGTAVPALALCRRGHEAVDVGDLAGSPRQHPLIRRTNAAHCVNECD